MQPMMRRLQILIRLLYSAPHSKVLISKSLRVYLYCGVCVKTPKRERGRRVLRLVKRTIKLPKSRIASSRRFVLSRVRLMNERWRWWRLRGFRLNSHAAVMIVLLLSNAIQRTKHKRIRAKEEAAAAAELSRGYTQKGCAAHTHPSTQREAH